MATCLPESTPALSDGLQSGERHILQRALLTRPREQDESLSPGTQIHKRQCTAAPRAMLPPAPAALCAPASMCSCSWLGLDRALQILIGQCLGYRDLLALHATHSSMRTLTHTPLVWRKSMFRPPSLAALLAVLDHADSPLTPSIRFIQHLDLSLCAGLELVPAESEDEPELSGPSVLMRIMALCSNLRSLKTPDPAPYVTGDFTDSVALTSQIPLPLHLATLKFPSCYIPHHYVISEGDQVCNLGAVFPNLTYLDLTTAHLPFSSVQGFSTISALKTLVLDHAKFDSYAVVENHSENLTQQNEKHAIGANIVDTDISTSGSGSEPFDFLLSSVRMDPQNIPFQSLTALDVSGLQLSARALQAISSLSLASLCLARCELNDDGIRHLVSPLTSRCYQSLKEIAIVESKSTSDSMTAMQLLLTFPRLDRIDCSKCWSIDNSALLSLANQFASQLRFLKCGGYQSPSLLTGLATLLATCTKLTKFKLVCHYHQPPNTVNGIVGMKNKTYTCSELSQLLAIPSSVTKLTLTYYSSFDVTYTHAPYINSPLEAKLETVKFRSIVMGDDLARNRHTMPVLTDVSLQWSSLTPLFSTLVAPKLAYLNLSHSTIPAQYAIDIDWLFEPCRRTLETLIIDHCPFVSDSSIQTIGQLPQLQMVNLRGCDLLTVCTWQKLVDPSLTKTFFPKLRLIHLCAALADHPFRIAPRLRQARPNLAIIWE